ncbi:hypothetical protein M514_09558 [Trichuris suis]|uniref:Uncharacterized protein n=1 Tax=Trichuris suis TaxID=68888 RepID=A0A085LX37_9BILA|nr:hypothetical protein M513_09558 [Trichuris suis]KFD59234.1 hypothetical protein M514_09558 [Trichuris suis]
MDIDETGHKLRQILLRTTVFPKHRWCDHGKRELVSLLPASQVSSQLLAAVVSHPATPPIPNRPLRHLRFPNTCVIIWFMRCQSPRMALGIYD